MNVNSLKQNGHHAPHSKKHFHRTEPVQIQVQDDQTGTDRETLKRALLDNLYYVLAKDRAWATPHDYFMELSYTVRDRLLQRWIKTVDQTYLQPGVKVVCYQGQELRLQQQYFFVSCSLQDLIRNYLQSHSSFDHFVDKVAIQINDTHPSIGIAKLAILVMF